MRPDSFQAAPPLPSAQDTPAPVTRAPRLWPAVILIALFWTYFFVRGHLELETPTAFFSWLICCAALAVLFLLWWLTCRGLPFTYKLLVLLVAIVGGAAASVLSHPSLQGVNNPDPNARVFARVVNLLTLGIPPMLTTWIVWMILTAKASIGVQRLGLLIAILAAWSPFTLVRLDGLSGDLRADLRWRWSKTAEEMYQEAKAGRKSTSPATDTAGERVTLQRGDWPGFRGPNRDSKLADTTIDRDWTNNRPKELWRERVGPAWSSVAVLGDRVITQEQDGKQEAVVCYDAASGKQLWSHEQPARFDESVSGVGPRATPTFAKGYVYCQGGTGHLSCLDAATGKEVWSKDVSKDAEAKLPMWGYSSSPLIVDNLVITFGGGDKGKSLLAYSARSGELTWTANAGKDSYSSPQLATLSGKQQVLFFGSDGLCSFEPKTGAPLWSHPITAANAIPTLQPQVVGPKEVLVGLELGVGLALLDVQQEKGTWKVSERWRSKSMKPAFNDYVVHDGFVYGFDGSFFCCVDLETGERRWKDGRYGHGQVLLLPKQGLLVVLTEEPARVILVQATPDQHRELGRFQALEHKTWNHPVIAHGRLFIRNAEEMACFQLASPSAQ